MNRRLSALASSLFLFVAVTFVLPTLVSRETGPFCSISRVNAQDNPCLEQAATISAMQVSLVQSTLDAINHQTAITALQGTLAAYESGAVGAPVTGGSPASRLSGGEYTETFSDNSRGWELNAGENWARRLSQGQLLLSGDQNWFVSAKIPGLTNERFYIEVTVTPRSDAGYAGFVLTDSGNGDAGSHYFLFGDRCNSNAEYVLLHEFSPSGDDLRLLETRYSAGEGDFWRQNRPFTLGFEGSNGFYSLYINGEFAEGIQISPYGADVGLAFYNTCYGEESAFFDNLIVTHSR